MLVAETMNGPAKQTPSPLRVLLAESSALVREGLRQMLAEVAGVVVAGEVANCADMHAFLRSTKVDLVLLDIGLPCQDLFTAISSIRMVRPELRMIALSQINSRALDKRYIEAGVDLVLNKTAGLKKLVQAIAGLAKRSPEKRAE